MKIDRNGKPAIIIGMRVTIAQVVMSLTNGGVFLYNATHPDAPLPGEVVGMVSQPLIFALQVWWVNRHGVTT